jgi:hypothetical protein
LLVIIFSSPTAEKLTKYLDSTAPQREKLQRYRKQIEEHKELSELENATTQLSGVLSLPLPLLQQIVGRLIEIAEINTAANSFGMVPSFPFSPLSFSHFKSSKKHRVIWIPR